MPTGPKRHRPVRRLGGGAIALACALALVAPTPAGAAGPPIVTETWASQVFASSTRLNATVNPNGIFTTYHFEYLTKAKYEANGGNFNGAARVPAVSEASIGSGESPQDVLQQVSGLQANTAYRYRIVAHNSSTTTGPIKDFVTQVTASSGTDSCANAKARVQTGAKGSEVPDCRGYELVSPIDKNGGDIAPPGFIAAGGVLQAASQGSGVTYGSTASFAGGQGAPPASQYLATRSAGGWSTQNLTQPIFSGSYDSVEGGVPYQLFSSDLARAILLNGDHCRGEGEDCAVANPPLSGTDAPAGYQNYYLREGGTFTALLGGTNSGFLTLEPKEFDLRLAGSSADLKRPVVETCAALSANATEVPEGEGCDPEATNLYLWTGSALSLLNLLPGEGTGSPGATLAAQAGAVSTDGTRVYFTYEGDLYLRASGQTKQADEDAGGEGSFETASADGTVAFFTKAGHLWRYLSSTDTATDITPGGGVQGVLGASANGSIVYFQDASALKRWSGGSTSTVASGAEAAMESTWPPATGASRVSADGSRLLFLSAESLSGYDNTDLNTGEPDPQVFLWDGALRCVSCNPTLGRPRGPSSIPGAIANGTAEGSTRVFKPRVLSANGKRVFFDSRDAIAAPDTNNAPDAYQWEAQGEGDCNRSGGCVGLISSGRSVGGAAFVDSSADGSDAFILTGGSLVKEDPGAADLYDARVNGGFEEPPPEIICEGDSCQPLPSPPVDPTLTTLIMGPGNPGIRFPELNCRPRQRRAAKLARQAKRARRATKRARGARARRARRRAQVAAKQAKRARKSAKRCLALKRGSS